MRRQTDHIAEPPARNLHEARPVHRIALRCLFHDRGRLIAAVTGVAVATVLMLVQVGIYYGFADVASAPVRRIGGDVWVMSRDNRFLDHTPVLRAGADGALRDDPCVASVRAAIFYWTVTRRESGTLDTIELVGVDPSGREPPPDPSVLRDTSLRFAPLGVREPSPGVPWNLERGLPSDLAQPGRLAIDVRDATRSRDPIGAPLDVGGRRAYVGALAHGQRANFGIHPMAIGSARTIRDITGVGPRQSSYWIADLRDPACAPSLIAAVERDPELRALETDAFAARVERQILESSGIGLALGFIALLGFAVAAVVVAQTLVAILRQHRRELAMWKALGARPTELLGLVAWQTAFIAIAGTSIGTALAFALRRVLVGASVPVILPDGAVVLGALTVVALCALASLGSVREVWKLEANEVLA